MTSGPLISVWKYFNVHISFSEQPYLDLYYAYIYDTFGVPNSSQDPMEMLLKGRNYLTKNTLQYRTNEAKIAEGEKIGADELMNPENFVDGWLFWMTDPRILKEQNIYREPEQVRQGFLNYVESRKSKPLQVIADGESILVPDEDPNNPDAKKEKAAAERKKKQDANKKAKELEKAKKAEEKEKKKEATKKAKEDAKKTKEEEKKAKQAEKKAKQAEKNAKGKKRGRPAKSKKDVVEEEEAEEEEEEEEAPKPVRRRVPTPKKKEAEEAVEDDEDESGSEKEQEEEEEEEKPKKKRKTVEKTNGVNLFTGTKKKK